MADIKISELPIVNVPTLADIFPVIQDGITKQESVSQLSTLLAPQTSGTFTPAILFGGASVGVTGTFAGYYVKTGLQVDIQITITLTNKGSSVGNVTIGSLPFAGTDVSNAQKWIPLYLQNCTAIGTTYTYFAAQVGSGTSSAALYNFPQTLTAAAQLTNLNFSNSSIIILSGTYWTN